ncbi:MAG: putative lipid II flippase FtsW [Deltaproteobacteria bacterium]|jgi:cell division protein FtsW|nr:putative lipid II flippase FtsW [Deltaproteobacteria bacterium]
MRDGNVKANGVDAFLLSVFLLLLGIGLVNLLSASAAQAALYRFDAYYYFENQAIRALIGLGLVVLIYFLPGGFLRRISPAALVGSLVLLGLSFLPYFRDPEMVTYRWIRIFGVSVQPSEFARVGVVMFMAWSLSRLGDLVADFRRGFLPHLLLLAVFGFLVVLQKDLGGAFIVAALVVGLCFLSGMRSAYFLIFAVILGVAGWYYIVNFGYRVNRISGWLDPFADPQNKGYVILHSFYAFANGGILGVGPGQSLEKLFFIPQVHTDYIFSVVGEEMGLVGVAAVAGLFLTFVFRGFHIARAAGSLFDYYLACGATMMIALPAFVNMAVALSILPSKGLALPFFSYGGSNMLVSCLAVGLLLNVAKRTFRKEEPSEGEYVSRLSMEAD